MSTSAHLIDKALQMPEPERAESARRLLLSLESDDFDADAEDVWAVEIERRLASVERGNFQASDWRDVAERVRGALRDGEDENDHPEQGP